MILNSPPLEFNRSELILVRNFKYYFVTIHLKIYSDISLCLKKYPFSLGNIFHIIKVIFINNSITVSGKIVMKLLTLPTEIK